MELVFIPVVDLLVDNNNPRFDSVAGGDQRSAIAAMIAVQGDKIFRLAQDIVDNGLNIAEALIVMPAEVDASRFVVLEGNRRATALKILTSPNLVQGIVDENTQRRFRNLSEIFWLKPIKEVSCVVVNSRQEADYSIRLRHGGELQGEGISAWGARERQRYLALIEGSVGTATLQVFSWVQNQGTLSDQVRDNLNGRWFSTLQRLIDDLEVRRILGIELTEDGYIATRYNQSLLLQGVSYIVTDLALGTKNVNHFRTKDERSNYAYEIVQRLGAGYVPLTLEPIIIKITPQSDDHTDGQPDDNTNPTNPSDPDGGNPNTPQRKPRPRPLSTSRTKLIPASFRPNISRTRINNILIELKKISIEGHVNSVAVMFRVFLDLSVTEFVRRKKLVSATDSLPNQKLRDKLNKTADYFEENGILSHAELQVVRHAAQDQTTIMALQTFNAFVHEPTFEPIANDLKRMWDNLQPFMEKIWQEMPKE